MRLLVRSLQAQHVAQQYAAQQRLLPPVVGHPAPLPPVTYLAAVALAYDSLLDDATGLVYGGARIARAYRAFAEECAAQRRFAEERMGVCFVPWQREDTPPYATSQAMLDDLARTYRLAVFTGGAPHPVLSASENWTFRCVHDLFGHAATGLPFSPRGEFNAYLAHAALFSPLARRALATETLGQSAWVNFHPSHAHLPPSRRPYAPQKADFLPEKMTDPWALHQGVYYSGPFGPPPAAVATADGTIDAPAAPAPAATHVLTPGDL